MEFDLATLDLPPMARFGAVLFILLFTPYVARRLRVPTVVVFIVGGMIIGPHCPGSQSGRRTSDQCADAEHHSGARRCHGRCGTGPDGTLRPQDWRCLAAACAGSCNPDSQL